MAQAGAVGEGIDGVVAAKEGVDEERGDAHEGVEGVQAEGGRDRVGGVLADACALRPVRPRDVPNVDCRRELVVVVDATTGPGGSHTERARALLDVAVERKGHLGAVEQERKAPEVLHALVLPRSHGGVDGLADAVEAGAGGGSHGDRRGCPWSVRIYTIQ